MGRGHDYVTVVTGIADGKPSVPHQGDRRDEDSLHAFYEQLKADILFHFGGHNLAPVSAQ